MFDSESDVVVINEWSEFSPKFASRGRGTGRPGAKRRVTIEVESQPLLHMFDENMLGAKPAEAMRAALSKGIKNITALASRATQDQRKKAEEAFAAGKAWAVKRYSGRKGGSAPNQTPRLFNDSGRLADGLFVRQNPTDKTFTVNTPANRLDPTTFKGDAFQRMLNRLRELVPLLQDGRRFLQDEGFRKAVNESILDMISRAESNEQEKLRALYEVRKRLVMATLRALATIAET